ncbi:hypothetical protein [Gimesia maris]|uniref:hypothetical protein n=1 Tax=Gimesia maris TaxID=122 RepID=UPI0012B7A7B1|nr:hypothetical protein [Gimesia maris]
MMDFHLSARLIGNNRVHRLNWNTPRKRFYLKLLSFREFVVEVRHKGELYVIGSVILLVIVWLLVWSCWTRHLTITFLDSGKPIEGLTMEVILANAQELNGKVFRTNADGQIILSRPSVNCDAVVILRSPNGRRVNTSLPIKRVSWTSFEFGPTYDKDHMFTTKSPGQKVTQRSFPDPPSSE